MAAGDALDVGRSISDTMDVASKALTKATRDALRESGKVAREELMAQARIVPGPDRAFSNMGGARLAVRLRYAPGEVNVIPRGPWGIAEEGARPHEPNHPGTRSTQGRQSWTTGRDSTFARLDDVVEQIGADVERAVRQEG